jgi:hypothetical protein
MTWPNLQSDALMGGLAIVAVIAMMVLAVLLSLAMYGRVRWEVVTQMLLGRLASAQQVAGASRYDAQELDGLPEPVQRYFRAVLTDGQAIITSVKVTQSGRFNLRQGRKWWRPFTVQQSVVMHRPGFVWDARIVVLPGIAVHVHDAYLSGQGILKPSLFGVFPLADLHDDGELARGDQWRHGMQMPLTGEALWMPLAGSMPYWRGSIVLVDYAIAPLLKP